MRWRGRRSRPEDLLYGVIGLGQFGYHVVRTLAEGGRHVIAADLDERRVNLVRELVGENAIVGDMTDPEALREAGFCDAQWVVLALGEEHFEETLLVTVQLRDAGVPHVIVRTTTELRGRILLKVGAERIVYPEREMGVALAKQLLTPGLIDWVTVSSGKTVSEIKPRRDFVGKTLAELDLRKRFGVAVIAAHRFPEGMPEEAEPIETVETPGAEYRIGPWDTLVVAGAEGKIRQLADPEFLESHHAAEEA